MFLSKAPHKEKDAVFKELYRRIRNNPEEYGLSRYDLNFVLTAMQMFTYDAIEQEDGQIVHEKVVHMVVKLSEDRWRFIPVSKFKLTKEQLRAIGME